MTSPHQNAMIDIAAHACHLGASDIHIEPQKQGTQIRVRVNGALSSLKHIDQGISALFNEHIKSLFKFDMSRSGIAQDARWAHPNESFDFRCNLLPTRYGEKICLRILEREKDFSLENYPLYKEPKNDLFRIMNKKQGLIIVSGPTGSRKSTLLYSILGSLDRKTLNISTVEDPIEYELKGLNQTPINRKKGFGFCRSSKDFNETRS